MKSFKVPSWLVLVTASAAITFAGVSVRAELNPATETAIKASLSGVKLVEAPYRAAKLISTAAKADRSAVVRAAVEEVLTQHPTAVAATVRAVLTVVPDESPAVMAAVLSKAPKAYRVAMVVIAEISPSSVQKVASLVSSEMPEFAKEAQKMADVVSATQSPDNGLAAGRPVRAPQFNYFGNPVFTAQIQAPPPNPPSGGSTNEPPVIKIIRRCLGSNPT